MKNTNQPLSRRGFLKGASAALAALYLRSGLLPSFLPPKLFQSGIPAEQGNNPLFPDSVDPVLSATMEREIRIPNTSPALNGLPNLHASPLEVTPLIGAQSLTGHTITNLHDPNQALELSLNRLLRAAQEVEYRPFYVRNAAQDIMNILTGETQGQVYDGFAMLNYNRGAYVSDQIDGQYKMKRLRESGETILSQIDGEVHKIWEVDINMLWHGQNFDSDLYLLRIPYEAHPFDEIRVNWRIYSLIQEDLAPTTILNDGFARIYHGLDSTFVSIPGDTLSEISVKYPSVQHLRGMYIWGWGAHPPRVQFLQPVVEINENGDLHPHGRSFAERTAIMSIDDIGEAAPEKKAYRVAEAALNGAPGTKIARMLLDPDYGPKGTFHQWIQLAADQRRLPPEAWDVLAEEDGFPMGTFGSYDIILAYMNNEIYGESPYAQADSEGKGGVVRDWEQGNSMRVKVINLDNHVHYYRNVDFGAQLIHENKQAFGNGKFSFEKFSPKPSYGVPKVAEMQWRTGWGYVPHVGIAGQPGLFPRPEDQELLVPFTDQLGQTHHGYLFRNVSGYWRFNPPAGIREGDLIEAGDPLRDEDGEDGVKISFDAEAFGVAKMPEEPITTHPDQENFAELNFPGFLRNPTDKGDIIPPTPIWSPFLALNPITGDLKTPDGRWWVDDTYLHGSPVAPLSSITPIIEAPRAAAQLFYQFDPLFHDNMIFSYHPRSDIARV